jgi:hypothetical protein
MGWRNDTSVIVDPHEPTKLTPQRVRICIVCADLTALMSMHQKQVNRRQHAVGNRKDQA